DVPQLVDGNRVGCVDAGGSHRAAQIDPVIERLAIDVAGGDAVGKRARDRIDAAVRVQITKLRRLRKGDGAAIERSAGRELIARSSARGSRVQLAGHAV